ncbi:MAG: hypothetical protein ACTSRG_10235 [Candidatus Helarchaeota archaeon]
MQIVLQRPLGNFFPAGKINTQAEGKARSISKYLSRITGISQNDINGWRNI